jgi:hypothetical protein
MFEKKTHNGIEYNQSTSLKGWKIVHNDSKIIVLACDTSRIGTMHNVYFTPNFRSMMQYINTNKLDVNSIELDNYDKYYNEIVGEAVLPNDNDLIEFLNTFTFND